MKSPLAAYVLGVVSGLAIGFVLGDALHLSFGLHYAPTADTMTVAVLDTDELNAIDKRKTHRRVGRAMTVEEAARIFPVVFQPLNAGDQFQIDHLCHKLGIAVVPYGDAASSLRETSTRVGDAHDGLELFCITGTRVEATPDPKAVNCESSGGEAKDGALDQSWCFGVGGIRELYGTTFSAQWVRERTSFPPPPPSPHVTVSATPTPKGSPK